MRKLLIASLLTSAVAVAAHAGSISLDARGDYEAKNYNDAYVTQNYNHFFLQTARVDFKGAFNEATSYRLRVRFNKSATNYTVTSTMRAADSANDALDFAYIQHKWSDSLTAVFGKFGTDIGGFEGMTSGADLYFTGQSYVNDSPLRYGTGAKMIYTVAGQEINLMAMNEQADAYNGTFDQKHQAIGVVYKGSFMDKSILPYVGYFMDNVQASTIGTGLMTDYDKQYTYTTVGVKWDAKPVFVEADYSMDSLGNRAGLDQTDKTNTLVATVGYKIDNYTAKLKFESSDDTFNTTATANKKYTYTGMQLAAEYTPTGDKNFRYHVAYMTRNMKTDVTPVPANPVGDKLLTTVVAGIRLYADFLK